MISELGIVAIEYPLIVAPDDAFGTFRTIWYSGIVSDDAAWVLVGVTVVSIVGGVEGGGVEAVSVAVPDGGTGGPSCGASAAAVG